MSEEGGSGKEGVGKDGIPLPPSHSPLPNFGFIFDMDGVIADTVGPHLRSWRRLAEEIGVPLPDEGALLGRKREEALAVLLGEVRVSGAERGDLLARKQRYFLEEIEAFGPRDALPGVLDLLTEARVLGVPLALASSSRNVELILGRLGIAHLFDAVADGNTVANPKPAPDIFVWAAGRLGLPPARCAVFEDAPAGVAAGVAGGFLVVGLGPATRVGNAHLVRPDLRGARVAEFVALVKS